MKLYKVKGVSMHPFLRGEDLVVVKKVPFRNLRTGNILVFEGANGGYIIHRLVKKKEQGLACLRGDGYNLSIEEVEQEAIIGKAVGVVRAGRLIKFSRRHELYYWTVARVKEFSKNLLKVR